MSIFLTQEELAAIKQAKDDTKYINLYWGMLNRVQKYSESPGMVNFETNSEWWHNATEYLTEAAWVCKVQPNSDVEIWLRDVTLALVRCSDYDWIGPFFRKHDTEPPQGHLETAHLSIAVSIVLDLATNIFTESEIMEIKQKLKETAIPLCLNWIKANRHLANWRCILMAGATVAAAVIDDQETLAKMRKEYEFCLDVIQPDGTYAESLQYSNYCYFGLMLTYESLVRRQPKLIEELTIEPYAKAIHWFIHSFFYLKPLAGWGAYPRPRSANFNDSAAIFGADADLLAHISARVKNVMPKEAGLARWMFDKLYGEFPGQGPFDRNTFGFVNRYSLLSMILYPQAALAISPTDAKMPEVARYSNGHNLVRNDWGNSKTILAFSGAPDPLHGPGHLHADLNSLILVHNKERMLADPGHTCYRTYIHAFETETKVHNTCTFKLDIKNELQESNLRSSLLQQGICGKRSILEPGKLDSPVERGGKHLISAKSDDVTVIGSDVGAVYSAPVERFERFCIMCGDHALFIIDRINFAEPVVTCWNWLLNNRDNLLEYKLVYPDKIVARRGNAGMKLFHFGAANVTGPVYSHIHDAYHPLPQQLGEGAPGSGLQFIWADTKPATSCFRVHGIALDTYGNVARWHLRQDGDDNYIIEGPNKSVNWNLQITKDSFVIKETEANRTYVVRKQEGNWGISK